MGDLKDILSNEEEQVNEDELMNYLEGNLSEEEKHAFERKTSDSSFASDALEGLQQFKNKNKLDEYVSQLNKNLQEQLTARKQRNNKRRLKYNQWFLLTIVVILALCVLGYFIISIYNKRKVTALPFKTEFQVHFLSDINR
jgi:anti-sigma factor RsiW